MLGLFVLDSLNRYRSSVSKVFGPSAATWLVVLTASQFHFAFYLSRPLPNVFALVLCLRALHHWLEAKQRFRFILASAAAIIIFRGELAILLGTVALADMLVGRKISIVKFFAYGVIALVVTLGVTVAVDSYFWRRTLWPEGEVLYYNVVLNKSSNWGTSPWPWYFYSVLPR